MAKGAQRTLIVARVAFGETFKTLQPIQGSARPPDAPDGLAFDSVWADGHDNGGCVDHPEVMIYSEGQALPHRTQKLCLDAFAFSGSRPAESDRYSCSTSKANDGPRCPIALRLVGQR